MTTEELNIAKQNYFIQTNGGIALPAAGFIYWFALGICGFFVSQNTWALIGFFTSGMIFPLGLLLSKLLKSNIMAKGPLTSLVMPAMTAMFLSWGMIIPGYLADVSLTPLFIAIGMSLHWPVIGWMYGSKTCLAHAISRVVLVTLIWFALPEYRFTLIPLLVSLIYLITIFGLKKEVLKIKSNT